MKSKLLLTLIAFLLLLSNNLLKAQNVAVLPGETTTIETAAIYSGDFGASNTSGSGFSCNYNKGRGILSIGAEVQSDNYSSWDDIRISFYYNGYWHQICQYNMSDNQSGCDWTGGSDSRYYTLGDISPTCNISSSATYQTLTIDNTYSQIGKMGGGFSDRYQKITLKNNGFLNVYHGNYLPQTGVILNRVTTADNNMWGIQTAPYTLTGKAYPCFNDPNPATKKTTGYDVTNYVQYGNLPGFVYNQYTTNIAVLIINIANLPPDMLEAPNFKVHIYALSNGNNHNRIYETNYSNQNFMTQGPNAFTATKNLCGKVTLNWSNSNNVLPDDGTVTLKNVVFRNGAYLATISGTTTTYDDITAVQDVEYDYTVRHVAFSETGETYYRSPLTAAVKGSVKPSPDEPITPSASTDKCTGLINLAWGFNGANPDKFRIDYATNSGGPFTMITNTLSGGSRSFSHTSLTRGQQYYYRVYAINTCSVLSTTYANCNGISPADPTMASSITATSNSITNTVDLTWADNANNEDKYQIVRTDDQGNTVLTDVNANSSSYIDNSAAACRLYTYKIRVFNSCVLSGVTSTTSAQATLPPPNLQNTFDATHKLTGSKGYFNNRVELSWGNNNGVNIDLFKIYRKQLGTALDSVQIGTASTGSALYIDNTADSRVFYRYTIVGLKQCNGADLYTNISSDIGFRNPGGLVSGHIEYNGGVAVSGAKVLIQPSGANVGTALNFATNGTLTINDSPTLEPGAQMRCEFWYKAASGNATVLNKANAFSFNVNGSNAEATIYTSGVAHIVNMPAATFNTGNWIHVAMVYNGATFKVFTNGAFVTPSSTSGALSATGVDNTTSNIVFGGGASVFNLDEFRLIGQAVADSIISIESNRILNGDETGFRCNLHFDEATGSYAYDPSKVGNLFNGNHGNMNNAVTWTSDRPTGAQLGYFGITDALGNYNASGIRFVGSGENFNLVPQFQTHSFTPNSRSVYIGDGSLVFNNQDFIDNSSFPFTGTLFYAGLTYTTSCPVPGASLKIDGLPVIANGTPIMTDANGTFSISVPIGNHFVTIEKFGHDMKDGRYPPVSGTHNFQAPLSSITFMDSTLVKLVGRVVGGKKEADKAANLGRSKNNIGSAKLLIASPLTGTPCFTAAVVTNSATGEYVFIVPPMQYKLNEAFVITNSVVIGKNQLSNTSNVIDLTNTNLQPTVIDTLKNNLGGVQSIDSTKYHKRIDFIYRNAPIIDVRKGDASILHGEDTLYLAGTKVAIRPVQTNTSTLGNYGWGALDWPVFMQSKTYSFNIFANEIYTNTDNGKKDTVLLFGDVSVTNEMVNGADPNANISFTKGIATYSFTCGLPNLATIPGSPDISYTKNIQIAVIPDGAATMYWEPNATITPSNKHFHAYVYGQRVTGTGVSTQGPEKVDFILRDPPGSGSSSTWSTGNSITKSTSISTNFSSSTGLETSLLLGQSAHVGLGYSTAIDIDNNITLGLNVSTSFDTDKSMTETISSSYAVSTRDDAGNVGAPADIFIGRARNWLMGPTGSIEMVETSKCAGRCFGPVIGTKQLAKTTGFAISPNGVKTRFSYTQNEIEKVVIPTLEALRNSILVSRPYYTIVAASTHSLFASNNDDPLWGAAKTTTNPEVYDNADTTGQSYIFRGLLKYKTDTVRLLNSQIALWKKTLGQNEKEKYLAKFSTNTPTVIANPNYKNPFTDSPTITVYPPILQDNFTLGSAVVANAYQVDNEDSYSESYEVAVDESISATIGAQINGIGFAFNPHVSFTQGNTKGSSTTNATTNSMEYILTDGDPGDIMSVDVYRYGLSNIFVTRGGQTMCPYEDAVVCHYWDPANQDKWISSHNYNVIGYHTLSNATVQREIPNISITPAVQYNIPSNQPAVYQLLLSNQSPLTVNNDIDLQVRVASVSNPNGAVLKIDGQNANAIINIPSGGSVVKTLTIERGPIEINYDSLMVIFSSACSEDIADTAYVSVHFIPTCTDLSITAPTDNFIINNSNNSLSNITIEDYNYNYGAAQNTSTVSSPSHPYFGFEKIGFEFKPANSSSWLQVQEFFKYPTAVGSNSLFPIPQGQVYTQYQWTVTTQSYADGNYELRTKSYCYNKDGSYAIVYSPVLHGVMDRVNPAPFGSPSPADGILDPNDDISIQFNEPIDISSLSYAPASNPASNFDIRGVLNGTILRHSESLNFDGIANYAEVAGGAALQKRPFTMEFWAKFNPTGSEQVVISQGTDPIQKMTVGFDASNNLKFALGTQVAVTTSPIMLPTDWHHYAVIYDYANTDLSLFVDGTLSGTNNNFLIDYTGSGKLAFGKDIQANSKFFKGNMHEVRLWSKARTSSDLVITMNKTLSRNQSGLVYNWKMDEATGSVAGDNIRSRNADIYGATWEINPNGNATQFDGVDDNIKVSSGNITINKEMDFTLEFWFNSNQTGVSTLFSNGAGVANTADSLDAWTIQKDAAGALHVYHKGLDFVATSTNYFDNKWHHFALVMQRSTNLSAYVDGNLQNSVQAVSFNNLSGSNLYLGAKATVAGTTVSFSDHFNGKLDEFRLWNVNRKAEQIKRDKQNRMLGDEQGLLAFLPFENYTVVLGTPSLSPTFNNQSLNTLTVTAQNGASLIAQTPTIKLPRPVQNVNYTWALNGDKIILTTNTAPELIENVTLDITVKNALDMHGNKMQSPKTWIAYINKNQVKWQDDEFNFEKKVDSVITFVAPIVNSGGAQKAFTIDGLPTWMTANTTSGLIAPNSTQNITFTIPAGGTIGEYNTEVSVTTDFNFAEILKVNLKVKGVAPTWTVNPSNYQYSMSLFGQMKIDNVISTNTENKVAAINNGTVCGVANLQYVPAYDRYEVFMNIYNNNITGDSIKFNLYDAASGLTFVNVNPTLMFVENDVQGTITNPITFVANTEIQRDIKINAGWTWVSFPLKTNNLQNSNLALSSLNSTSGDVVVGSTAFDQFDASMGWLGNISSGAGYKNAQSYKIKSSHLDTLVHIGSRLNPDSTQAQINVVPGWNWIGYVSNKNVAVNEALGNYNATTGDLLKSQYEFAYFDNSIGWTGSLTYMKPTLGYMLKSATTGTFSYPLSLFFGKVNMTSQTTQDVPMASQTNYPFVPEQFDNTMSAIITGNICNDALEQANIAIGAFDNTNTMRGFALPIKNESTNTYNYYLSLYSNTDNDVLNLKYFNSTDGSEMPTTQTIKFVSNSLVGTPSQPVMAKVPDSLACKVVINTTAINELDKTINVSVYPNPFTDNLTLRFNMAVTCQVELVDVLGKVVYSSHIKNKKDYPLMLDANKTNLAAGMYYVRLTGDVNQQIKVVKTK